MKSFRSQSTGGDRPKAAFFLLAPGSEATAAAAAMEDVAEPTPGRAYKHTGFVHAGNQDAPILVVATVE